MIDLLFWFSIAGLIVGARMFYGLALRPIPTPPATPKPTVPASARSTELGLWVLCGVWLWYAGVFEWLWCRWC